MQNQKPYVVLGSLLISLALTATPTVLACRAYTHRCD